MELLSDSSLYELLTHCHFNSGYKGLIAFNTIGKAKIFIEALNHLNFLEHIPGIIGISATHNRELYLINFKNNSKIQIVVYHGENMQGIHVHKILYDMDVDVSALAELRGIIIPYREEGDISINRTFSENEFTMSFINTQDRSEPQKSDELDNFLKSFSINK